MAAPLVGEESPGSAGRDTGEIPVPVTERTCHRNDTASGHLHNAKSLDAGHHDLG